MFNGRCFFSYSSLTILKKTYGHMSGRMVVIQLTCVAKIYGHIWAIYDHIWPIYGHIWPIYGDISPIYGHIWPIWPCAVLELDATNENDLGPFPRPGM